MNDSMREDIRSLVINIIIMLVIGFLSYVIGIQGGIRSLRKEMQAEAIELGHAEYNSHTGEWQWKEKP